MDSEIKAFIDRIEDESMRGAVQSYEIIVRLLELDPNSKETAYLKQAANRVAHAVSNDSGSISGAIGVDLCSCDMNCKFCSFGTAWGLVEENVVYGKEKIIEMVREYVEAGVTTITLRSTEFYDMKTLNEWLHDIREQVPGGYLINLNVGEMTPAMAEAAYQAGATCAYHVLRLREGVDTPFDPELRKRTMRAVSESPLRLGTCLEPIGVEHTNEELAERILLNMSFKPHGMSAMARVNVPGTPFEGVEPVSEARMLQILATVRLVVGSSIRNVGLHPATPESLYAGANNFTIERGANPRDTKFNETVWRGFTAVEAAGLLESAGFTVRVVDPDPRFRDNGSNWWVSGDPTQYVMPDPLAGDGPCCGKRA